MAGDDVTSKTAQALIDMGFEPAKVQKALSASDANRKCVETAMNWILSRNDDISDSDEDKEVSDNGDKSKKSKPLTEEEREKKLVELEKIRILKRSEREEMEKKEEIEREKRRVSEGKNIGDLRRELQDREIKKQAQLRRQEKIENEQARLRVKAQIEEDRRRRREESGASASNSPPKNHPISAGVQSSTETTSKPQQQYDTTRIQIRLPNGSKLMQPFKTEQTLKAVRSFALTNGGEAITCMTEDMKMMTNFPKRVFSQSDFDKSLQDLGLTPSAVIMISEK